jgi:hypothetical protein
MGGRSTRFARSRLVFVSRRSLRFLRPPQNATRPPRRVLLATRQARRSVLAARFAALRPGRGNVLRALTRRSSRADALSAEQRLVRAATRGVASAGDFLLALAAFSCAAPHDERTSLRCKRARRRVNCNAVSPATMNAPIDVVPARGAARQPSGRRTLDGAERADLAVTRCVRRTVQRPASRDGAGRREVRPRCTCRPLTLIDARAASGDRRRPRRSGQPSAEARGPPSREPASRSALC